MALATYVAMAQRGFSPTDQQALIAWHAAFGVDDAWRLIQRNLDRECARADIDQAVLDDFLREVASRYALNSWEPTGLVDEVLGARRSFFLLPGRRLPIESRRLSRVMRLDAFVKHQLQPQWTPIRDNLDAVITAVQNGTVTGHDLANRTMGRSGYPTWVAHSDDVPAGASADALRNLLGLKHIEHGHLVEVSYPDTFLGSEHLALRAPTLLDSVANGADNWIFAKRAGAGGPEWGHTVDIAKSAVGISEAVHREFQITAAQAAHIGVRYAGQITSSAPAVNFATLLAQT